MALSPLVRDYDHVLIDLDGCVWVGDEPTPRAVEAVEALRASGKGVAFVTNNAMHHGEEFVQRLWGMGFRASLEEVVTAGGALQHALATTPAWQRAFVIGAPAVHRHVQDAGLSVMNGGDDLASRVDVVVVAGHPQFDYTELRIAAVALHRGADLICSDMDATYPMPDGPWPGTGAMIAALQAVSRTPVQVAGKPGAEIFRTALDRLGPGRALVIGDTLEADIAGAHAAGLDSVLVLSGQSTAAAAQDWEPAPIAVAATLADAVLGP